ncbi:MAG: divergent polysaccharide deacetylase family protein, partial [Pseudomonadota bacterium]|nr:divergent polysaccharide deacetylase family protein [Pseudomonadota bacterium]
MFANRQSALAAAAGAPPAPRAKPSLKPVVAVLKKPPVVAALAGVFLLSSTALFLTVLGAPRAGAHSARIALDRAPAAPDAPAPTGFEAFSMGAMGLYQDLTGSGDPSGAAGGEALITLPDGASVAGGASYSAPVQPAS